VRPEYWVEPSHVEVLDSNWSDISGYTNTTGYPTENSEVLLERIINSATNKDDLVMDFFAGSGTTPVVAEKLGRRWIACDIGKFAYYTIQKRLLTIQDSKNLSDKGKRFSKKAKTFVTLNTGLYDLEKLNALNQERYTKFVLNLFEVEPKSLKANGVSFHGERKDGYNVLVWNFWQSDGAQVDEFYLKELHKLVNGRVGARVYIIAPANAVQFIGDYYEIDNVRYYFLKIPYQVIQELHREPFAKFRQPSSKNNINDLDNAVGFHFMRQPKVESYLENNALIIKSFEADVQDKNKNQNLKNLEALSMLILDEKFNGKEFVMSSVYFADELNPNSNGEISIPLRFIGDKIVAVYVDIFGNEFKQEIETKNGVQII
jgi:site-specific DNA-methyltransferase (adenine-specific)/adenine-specific DNA-methyltransferase